MNEIINLFNGGNGDSFESAIIINAANTKIGVAAEYAYVADQCGELHSDWSFISQSLQHQDGKHYDVLHISLLNGDTRKYHFDISKFYGVNE